jgi:cytidylate kinase
MQRNIITINREFGSGGGEIARLMGEKLGMKVYDRSMLNCIAKQFDMTVENIERVKAQKTNWWSDFCRFYKQFGAAAHTPNRQAEVTPLSIFYAEARVLRELAEEEDCIIVGRAGFHIFRDHPNALHLLIRAKRDARIARIAQKQNLSLDEAAKILDKVDEARDTFVKNVANTSRYDARNYDFTFNVTGMQIEKVADFLAENIRHKIEMSK